MSTSTEYKFFDRAVIDPVWRLTWKEFFRQHPRMQSKMEELLKFGFDAADGGEPSDEEIGHIFEERTLAWTIRRSTPQLSVMGHVMDWVPKLRPHSLGVCTGYTEDCFFLVAASIGGWVQGTWGDQTLRAILKLHSFQQPGHWLNLPKQLAAQVNRLLPVKVLTKPMYSWQGPEACSDCPSGICDYEGANCLGVADVKRFLAFLEQAWVENQPVPYLKDGVGMSVHPTARATVKFRDVDLARRLVREVEMVRRFEKPGLLRVVR